MAKTTKLSREARVLQLEKLGLDFAKNYFALRWSETDLLLVGMKADKYYYDSPLGRSRLRSYYYSLQRAAAKLHK